MTTVRITHRTSGDHEIRFLTAGSGPALVYLHGVGDTGDLLPVCHTLAATRTVIRPDHPGFLFSGPFAGSSVRELAAAHLTLLRDLDLGPVDLIGCSLGGWVAAELTVLDPTAVRTLTLIDPAGLPGDGSAPDVFATDPDRLLDLTVADPVRRAAARSAPADPVVTRAVARSRETAQRIAGRPYMHDPSLAGRLAGLSRPLQLFWGAQDGVLPVSYAADWTRAVPGLQVDVIDGAGHLPHVERPDEFLARFDPDRARVA